MPEPISVVVPTRDRVAMLGPCLEALRASLRPGDELLVVDSASRDGAAVREAALAHGARYERCAAPGASRARNRGWRAATRDTVAFVDDDVRVAPDWATQVAETASRHPEVDFFTGRLDLPPDYEGLGRPVAVMDLTEATRLDPAYAGQMGHSANLAVRRDALVRVGGFDESLGAGGRFRAAEDTDLFDRLLQAGALGRYEPAIAGWHEQWRGRRALLRLDWSYGIGAGARLVKLLRTDRRRARSAARTAFWTWGLSTVVGDLRLGYEFGVAFALTRVAGTVAGFLRALPMPVAGGHFTAPNRSRGRLGHGR